MDSHAVRLDDPAAWSCLGSRPDARKPVEVVVRTVDGPVFVATGETSDGPGEEGVLVPVGQGRRVSGRHFFVRAAPPVGPRQIVVRGL